MSIQLRFVSALAAVVLMGMVVGCNKVDLSTPKAAAKTFAHAVDKGDADTAVAASTGADPKTMTSFVSFVSSMKKLQDATKSKFGQDSMGGQQMPSFADMEKKVDEADVKENGDTATLSAKGDLNGITLKKVNGDWKVDFSDMSKGATQMPGGMDAMSKAASDTADEINAGKYKTAMEAQMALGQKVMGSALGGGAK